MKHSLKLGAALLLTLLGATQACSSSDDNPTPNTPIVTGGSAGKGSGGDAGNSSGGTAGTDNAGGSGADGGTSNGGSGQGGKGGSAGSAGSGGAPACKPEETKDKCFVCPQTNIQYWN